MKHHHTATGCHLSYGSHSVTCHLTQVNAPCLNPSYSYLHLPVTMHKLLIMPICLTSFVLKRNRWWGDDIFWL